MKWIALLVLAGCATAVRSAPTDTDPAASGRPVFARGAATDDGGATQAPIASAHTEDAGARRRRAVPADMKLDPAAYACRQPLRSYCRRAPCASLDDFRGVLDCRQMPLQRCGRYRLLAQISSLAGWIAAFDEQGALVSGVRWTDSGDFCGGTQLAAYYGRALDCTPEEVFEPWCE